MDRGTATDLGSAGADSWRPFPTQPRDFLNPLIGAVLGLQEQLLEDVLECFCRALGEVLENQSDPEDWMLGKFRNQLADQFRCNPGLIEAVAEAYIENLELGGIGSFTRSDPAAVADYIFRLLYSDPVRLEERVTHYALDWRLCKLYREKRVWELAPIHFLLDSSFPPWSFFLDAHNFYVEGTALKQVCFDELSQEHGVPASVSTALLHFFAANDPNRLVPELGSSASPSIAHALPLFELWATVGKLSLTGEIVGNSAADLSKSLTVELTGRVPFRASRRHLVNPSELLVKAHLMRRSKVPHTLGIPSPLYRALSGLAEVMERVVSVRDLIRVTGIHGIEVDPFDLLHGPLLAYAPGDRFLEGPEVSFVLKDWVETPDQRRSKISSTRILTPLRPVPVAPRKTDILNILNGMETWKRFGLVRLDDVRFLWGGYLKHEQRWARERTSRALEAILTAEGHLHRGPLMFSKSFWKRDSIGRGRLSQEDLREIRQIAKGLTSDLNESLLNELNRCLALSADAPARRMVVI
jgi:hypothetical protein